MANVAQTQKYDIATIMSGIYGDGIIGLKGAFDRAWVEQLLLHHGGAGNGVVEAIAQTHRRRSGRAGSSISARKQTTWPSELKRGCSVYYSVGSHRHAARRCSQLFVPDVWRSTVRLRP